MSDEKDESRVSDRDAEVASEEYESESAKAQRELGGIPIPQMDFVTFVLSLAHSTSCHLGVSPNPETKTCEQNLPLAKETIDILGMLQDKTQGNLTGEEERILSEVLFDLRMAFVQASRQ
jgi:hypothetical protein